MKVLILLAALVLFGILNLLVQLGTSFTDLGQEFGLVSDRYFPALALLTVLILNGILARQTKVSFLKSFRHNLATLLGGSVFIIFSVSACIENCNYFFTKRTVTEDCLIRQLVYLPEPPHGFSEGDTHIYPYYQLLLTIDGRHETLDARPAFVDSLRQHHLTSVRLHYREGFLGKKFVLTHL